MKTVDFVAILSMAVGSIALSACSSIPSLGGGGSDGSIVTGSAAGGSSVDGNSDLEKCNETLGTVSIFEDTQLVWWNDYRREYPKLGSTVPVIRLMVQQSNCFVIVERGRAMNAMNRERQLMSSGQLRAGSNVGGGQMVASDYTLSPSVLFSEQTGGIGGMLGSFGAIGKFAAGQMKSNEAETNLTLIDNRSGVQVSSANGSAENNDFGFLGGLFGGGAAAGAGGFSKTPEGKVVTAAFADSFNEMVKALKVYKAQTVKGGLGKGGRLTIGGEEDQMPNAQPAGQTVAVAPVVAAPTNVRVRSSSRTIDVDHFDEDAMEDYYKALKRSVEHMGNFSSMTAQQVEAMTNDPKMQGMGTFALSMIWGGPHVTQLETAQIELESWPVQAKQEAWNAYGSRILKYNKIFERHRSKIIANNAFGPSVINQLNSIELINEENLFR